MPTPFEFVTPSYLGQVFAVVDHEPDENVRYRLAEAESAFKDVAKGEFRSTNVKSDAPPDIPRFELKDGRKHLLIAQSRMQLGMTFDVSMEVGKAYETARKHAQSFFKASASFRALNAKTVIGFVVNINQPSDLPRDMIAQAVANELYKGPSIGKLTSIETRLGFETVDGLVKVFAFNPYEVRKFEIKPEFARKGFVDINMDSVPIAEMGLTCALDINNRSLAANPPPNFSCEKTMALMLKGMDEMFASERHQFLGFLQRSVN